MLIRTLTMEEMSTIPTFPNRTRRNLSSVFVVLLAPKVLLDYL